MRPHLTIQLPGSRGTVFGEGLGVSFQEEASLSWPSTPPKCGGSPPGISPQGPAFPALLLVQIKAVRPHRRQPTRLPRPWDSPGKNMTNSLAAGFSELLDSLSCI